MTGHHFDLKPFVYPAVTPPLLQIGGSISRRGDRIELDVLLQGCQQLLLPSPASQPQRQDDLWRSTCLEFFLGIHHSPQYWEFNCSPAGHWNVYRFNGYRSGMVPEADYSSLGLRISRPAHQLRLQLSCALPTAIPQDCLLDASITAVCQSLGGELSYWALTHPGREPDFHRRESFLLSLPAS